MAGKIGKEKILEAFAGSPSVVTLQIFKEIAIMHGINKALNRTHAFRNGFFVRMSLRMQIKEIVNNPKYKKYFYNI